jgi:hypothetical protein
VRVSREGISRAAIGWQERGTGGRLVGESGLRLRRRREEGLSQGRGGMIAGCRRIAARGETRLRIRRIIGAGRLQAGRSRASQSRASHSRGRDITGWDGLRRGAEWSRRAGLRLIAHGEMRHGFQERGCRLIEGVRLGVEILEGGSHRTRLNRTHLSSTRRRWRSRISRNRMAAGMAPGGMAGRDRIGDEAGSGHRDQNPKSLTSVVPTLRKSPRRMGHPRS